MIYPTIFKILLYKVNKIHIVSFDRKFKSYISFTVPYGDNLIYCYRSKNPYSLLPNYIWIVWVLSSYCQAQPQLQLELRVKLVVTRLSLVQLKLVKCIFFISKVVIIQKLNNLCRVHKSLLPVAASQMSWIQKQSYL